MELPPKILIIEDSIVVGVMMSATINRKRPEFEVEVEKTLKGGFEKFHTFKPHIIILDLTLPDSPQGNEALAAITEFRKRGVCVMAFSGHHDMREKALAMGANDFLSKGATGNSEPLIDRITAMMPNCQGYV